MSESITTHPDAKAMAGAVADAMAAAIDRARARRGKALLAVAGGSTPAPAYRDLDSRNLDFSNVTLVPTDERWVAPDHELSNDAMLRQNFQRALDSGLRIERLSVADYNIDAGIALVGSRVDRLDLPFDLVLLGMGTDGHTASVFPDDPAVERIEASAARIAIARPPSQPTARVTLTPNTLLDTAEVLLAISGSAKRAVIEAALESPNNSPIGRLLARCEPLSTIHWCP